MAISFEESRKAAMANLSENVTIRQRIVVPGTDSMNAVPEAASYTDGSPSVYAESTEVWTTADNYSYPYYSEFNDDRVSTINQNKTITLDPGQINISQEDKAQYIPFEMPRYYDGMDLSKAVLRIYFVNKEGNGGFAQPVNVQYSASKIRFGWLVDQNVTAVAGKVSFEIHANGTNSRNEPYTWKTRPSHDVNILESLSYEALANPGESWITSFFEDIDSRIETAQEAAAEATGAVAQVKEYADQASAAAQEASSIIEDAKSELETTIDTAIDEKITSVLNTYYTKEESDAITGSISDEVLDIKRQIENMDGLANFNVEYDGSVMTFYNGETVMKEIAINSDPTKEWTAAYTATIEANHYKKSETYNSSEIDEKLSNVTVDLTGYATEKYVDGKVDTVTSDVSENASGITSLNKTVAEINQTIEGLDKSPRITYDATYGDIELDDGTVAEDMFTLWKTENGIREVQDRFQIQGGGGGTSSSVTLRIAYVEGYTTPAVFTADESAVLKYNFSGEDSAGDTNLDGVASWKVGNRVVATQDVSTGEREFDLTDYVTVGDNKVVLTITHATGAVATKAWTIKIVDVRLDSKFDDTKTYSAGAPVTFTFTPYGGVAKTVHFLLDGEEIATKESSAAAAGLSDSFIIPAQDHGAHLFEVYMTANINGKTVESNHIVKDIIWYDASLDTPVIGCTQQTITIRQYEATNIVYTVYDPNTETPSVTLNAYYINESGEAVNEYTVNLVMTANTETWQYKTSEIGEHTLTITCGETVKTLTVTVVELGIAVSPVTTGLVFDFNPVGRSNNDTERLWNSGDIAMTVSDNFDWINGGYQIDENGDQCFCIKAGTSAEINYELFGDDAKASGKQFKLIFKTVNVASADAVFLSCLSDTIGTDKIGIEMKAHEATIYAKTENLPLPYAEEEIVEFEFNISSSDESPSMVMGYEDGVSTRPLVYDSTHDFQQYQGYRKTISLGSDDCDLYIYRFKVYNTSLSDRDILNNFIADARSAEEMISRYDRNQIYKEGILDPDYLAEMCPQLRVIKLEVPRFTEDKDDKVYVPNIPTIIESIYKGGDPIYDNWVAYDCVHSGQGTSSNNYGPSGRNLDLILKSYKDYGNAPYIILGDGSRVNKVSLTRESVPVNYFNVKVNIASSENANNALLQRRYNTYNPYKRPFVRYGDSLEDHYTSEEIANMTEEQKSELLAEYQSEADAIIPYIKDTMEFQNCVIFVKESDPDITNHVEFDDCNWHFYALGNIGDSKKTDSTRLTDPNDPYECILEVMDNTLPNSTMPTGVVDEFGAPVYPISPDQWVAGNSAYDSLHADKFDEKESSEKENGLADTYGWRYIYEDGTDEENAEYRSYVENAWKDFYAFVVTSTDEEFKAHLGDYCVLDSVLYYYLFTLRYTMTDNHAKNSFWHYGKSNDLDAEGNQIRKWDLSFDYDNDTALGIDNYGRMTYRYGYEEIDYVDGTSDWVWNAPNHVFFLRIRKLFDDELCSLYNRLETTGAWSSTSLINQFNEWQAQFPEELWRVDIDRKYIRTYTTSFINGKAYPEFLKERANGRKKTQRAQYEKYQEKYIASKFGGTVASADDIILRCSVPNTALVIKPNFDMHLTPYSHIYLNVKYNTSPPLRVRAVPDVEYTIPYTDELADIIEIYSASCLKSIGDLSACYLTNGTFANATKIRELVLGNGTEGYDNTNVMTLGLGSNELLNKLDVQNMSGLTQSLDLSGLKNLEELYAFGANVGGVIFADGGNIEIAQIPDVGSLEMKNLTELTDDGFEATSYSTLTKLVAEYSNLDLIELINSSPNLRQVRLIGVDWTLNDTSLLNRLYALSGVTNTGANSEHSVLSGSVHVLEIREREYAQYKERWPDLAITYDHMIAQHSVTFYNGDGSILEVQYVDFNSAAVDPTTRAENPLIPVKESTAEYEFTFKTWNRTFDLVLEDLYVTPIFTESIRQYTIKYLNMDGSTLQIEENCDYGSYHPYTGATPTYTAFEDGSLIFYLFSSWDKSGFVDGEKTINAVYDEFRYTNSAFEGKQFKDMTPVEIYALIRLKQRGILEIQPKDENLEVIDDECIVSVGDEYSFVLGNDLDFPGVDSRLLVAETGGESTPLTFTGNSYHNTGVTLFDEDKDFVLAIDYEFTSGNPSDTVLAQCYDNNIATGESGFRLMFNSSSSTADLSWEDSSTSLTSVGKREMLVIRHKKGSNTLTIYNSNLDGAEVTTVSMDNTPGITNTEPLIFGCYKYGNYYRNYAHGNIYWCKLWYMDLGDEVCKQLAIWPHEEITMQACMFENYEYSDGTKTLGDINLIAKNLLDRPMLWNNTTGNTGGWAEADLNTALNTRLYNAFPTQIRSLLKQVVVKSTAGGGKNNSTIVTSVTNSNCYIWLPAAIEIASDVSTYTGNGYKSEIDDTTQVVSIIPESGTIADSRICTNLDGTVNKYWLRSPNIAYPYVLTVDEKGSVYGFIESNRTGYGVRIMFTF